MVTASASVACFSLCLEETNSHNVTGWDCFQPSPWQLRGATRGANGNIFGSFVIFPISLVASVVVVLGKFLQYLFCLKNEEG